MYKYYRDQIHGDLLPSMIQITILLSTHRSAGSDGYSQSLSKTNNLSGVNPLSSCIAFERTHNLNFQFLNFCIQL